jgi:hypothetical protein
MSLWEDAQNVAQHIFCLALILHTTAFYKKIPHRPHLVRYYKHTSILECYDINKNISDVLFMEGSNI